MFRWRMESPCENCPFNSSGPGLHLRKTLRPGRWRQILKDLRSGKHFTCHKTADRTGNGTNLICAGSIEWEQKHGLCSQLRQIMERFGAGGL